MYFVSFRRLSEMEICNYGGKEVGQPWDEPLKRVVGGPRRADFLSRNEEPSEATTGSRETRRRGREEEIYARTRRERAERAAAVVNMALRRLETNRRGAKRGESKLEEEEEEE